MHQPADKSQLNRRPCFLPSTLGADMLKYHLQKQEGSVCLSLITDMRTRISHRGRCIGPRDLRSSFCDKGLIDSGAASDADRVYLQLEFEGFDGRRVVAAFDGGAVTSDAGAVLLRETDRAIGLIGRVAACFSDGRDPGQLIHALPTLVGQRIVAIVLGYEDVNDHDRLRFDPVLALFGDSLEAERKDCAPLAGKSTMNRLEHAPGAAATAITRSAAIARRGRTCSSTCSSMRTAAGRRHRRSLARPPKAGSSTATTTLVLSAALRVLPAAVGGEAQALAHRRRGRRQGRGARLAAASAGVGARADPARADSGCAREELMAWGEDCASITSSAWPATAGSSTRSSIWLGRGRTPGDGQAGARTSSMPPATAGAGGDG